MLINDICLPQAPDKQLSLAACPGECLFPLRTILVGDFEGDGNALPVAFFQGAHGWGAALASSPDMQNTQKEVISQAGKSQAISIIYI